MAMEGFEVQIKTGGGQFSSSHRGFKELLNAALL